MMSTVYDTEVDIRESPRSLLPPLIAIASLQRHYILGCFSLPSLRSRSEGTSHNGQTLQGRWRNCTRQTPANAALRRRVDILLQVRTCFAGRRPDSLTTPRPALLLPLVLTMVRRKVGALYERCRPACSRRSHRGSSTSLHVLSEARCLPLSGVGWGVKRVLANPVLDPLPSPTVSSLSAAAACDAFAEHSPAHTTFSKISGSSNRRYGRSPIPSPASRRSTSGTLVHPHRKPHGCSNARETLLGLNVPHCTAPDVPVRCDAQEVHPGGRLSHAVFL
ncbi:hypothetical protein OH77DRAFT_1309986 [Trametes cingulata]|nr:hypothetical protein OH77DRAFT_1309986 [Trametes cingulata]